MTNKPAHSKLFSILLMEFFASILIVPVACSYSVPFLAFFKHVSCFIFPSFIYLLMITSSITVPWHPEISLSLSDLTSSYSHILYFLAYCIFLHTPCIWKKIYFLLYETVSLGSIECAGGNVASKKIVWVRQKELLGVAEPTKLGSRPLQ